MRAVLVSVGSLFVLFIGLIIYHIRQPNFAAEREGGLNYAAKGNCAQAIPLLKRVVATDSTDVNAQEALGLCYSTTYQYSKALALLSSIAEKYPRIETFYNLASAAFFAGNTAEANTALSSAVKLSSTPAQYLYLAQAAESYGIYQLSENTLSNIPKTLRESQWYDLMAHDQSGQGFVQAAIKSETTALSLAPGSSSSTEVLYLSELYSQNGQCDKAIGVLIPSLSLQSNRSQPEIYSQIVNCSIQLGRNEQALQYSKQGAAIPFQVAGASYHFQFLLSEAQIYSAMNDTSNARSLLQDIISSRLAPSQLKLSAQTLLGEIP